MYPYNFKRGQTIQTDAGGVVADRAFIAHFHIAAADAVAIKTAGVHAAVTLGAAAQDVTTAITNPAVPRGIVVKGNAAGIAGNVVITGTNYADEEITETIALDGDTYSAGDKAFKTVTKINLPAKTNGSGDTVSVGWGDSLGLPYKLAHNTVIKAFRGGVVSDADVSTSVTAIESNTIETDSPPNGTDIDVYLIV